jgi:hypothetical protein
MVKWGQTNGDHPLYQEGRRLCTEEINAAVRGAKAAGATEIVVMDCHGAEGDYRGTGAFTTADRLVEYRNRRGVEQVDALTLVSKAGDWWSAWSQFYF